MSDWCNEPGCDIEQWHRHFDANPTQLGFIESRAEADFFSCRMGEGKSAALCWAIFHHTKENPGARWALIRDTWTNLEATTLVEFFNWFPDGVAGRYHKSSKSWTWTIEGVTGEIMFLGMDSDDDAQKLQSRPLAGIAIDEVAPGAQSGGVPEFIFDTAMTRLRQKGMRWYAAKLAANNPDEAHWTYKRFVEPGDAGTPLEFELLPEQERGFHLWQTHRPENLANLPPSYYESMAHRLRKRKDLVSRFAKGEFGFQQHGKPVTAEFNEKIHVVDAVEIVPGLPLRLLWDFGLNPTCLITQITPLGHWNFAHALVGEDVGVYELIVDEVAPLLERDFANYEIEHTGDPAGKQREQSSSKTNAVKIIQDLIPGRWRKAPSDWEARRDCAKEVLRKTRNGTGMVQIARAPALKLWHALRGGWHYRVSAAGIASSKPEKDVHSHPGDAFGYGCTVYYPLGRRRKPHSQGTVSPRKATYFGGRRRGNAGLGIGTPFAKLPKEARTILED